MIPSHDTVLINRKSISDLAQVLTSNIRKLQNKTKIS